jgi:pyrroloquinoline quinone biosynthesis protein E
MNRPYTLIAELTYRCPLACPYCANPLRDSGGRLLDESAWLRVFREAEALGVVQAHLTGGEPLLRGDLTSLVNKAHEAGLYVHLVTSGIPLDRARLAELREAGLDAMQLSVQSSDAAEANAFAGGAVFDRKVVVARWARELELPLTLNVVLHRGNIHRVDDIVRLAEQVGAHRLELANVQYAGWALLNRRMLLPTRDQLARARAAAETARARLAGTMELLYVASDFYADLPRACMDGWGRRFLVIAPDGAVLPCHAAHTVPGLPIEYAGRRPLADIWDNSALFNLFRGESWMSPPCRTCDRRTIDFGGCRCQAFHLTGQAGVTDPACRWSPHHSLVEQARREADQTEGGLLMPPGVVPRATDLSSP